VSSWIVVSHFPKHHSGLPQSSFVAKPIFCVIS
jgi:hypothetical protein